MDGFLSQVAADLYGRYGDDISSLSAVFPSRRATLFFGEALSEIITRPLWQPASITIDELMEELSGLASGDRLRLVTELYKIYREFHPEESFDTFYFWGELLLGDFDSIDKYLIDADVLFSNLVDLHELDSRFDYLEPEQRAVITKFWGSFARRGDLGDSTSNEHSALNTLHEQPAPDTSHEHPEGAFSPEQRDFLKVWRTLAPVYHRFRARLRDLGIAYQGMVYREAAERIIKGRAPQIPERHYIIAGFNALSLCEKHLFSHLQKNFSVDFYWDYDLYYTGDDARARAQEAGLFMRDNLRRFPPASPLHGGHGKPSDNTNKPSDNDKHPSNADRHANDNDRLTNNADQHPSDTDQHANNNDRLTSDNGKLSDNNMHPSDTDKSAGEIDDHDNFSKPKRIRSVQTGSDAVQCKYAGLRLADIARLTGKTPGKETAVVLTDESLLTPLLYSMPTEVRAINITMGYPLRMHPSYTFVERLIELQNRRRTSRNSLAFYHSDVEGLLRHPYLATQSTAAFRSEHIYINAARLRTTSLFEKIFTAPSLTTSSTSTSTGTAGNAASAVNSRAVEPSSATGNTPLDDWRGMSRYLIEVISEVARALSTPTDDTAAIPTATQAATAPQADIQFFALIIDHIRKLTGSLEACDIDISSKTYASLLRRSLQSVSVPFEGEPLAGVQVMGILETRALDFENIIFLSMNDSNSPGNLTGAPSFIPYNLKMAYGLPTPEHHEGVYAYHFFRLIQRARNVDMVWSSTTDDRNTGEPSRYILALDYESPHRVEKVSVSVDVNLSPREEIVVKKGSYSDKYTSKGADTGTSVASRLEEFLNHTRRLSPSLFFTYIECPLKFYFRGIARLRADEELSEEIDNATFGNILHRAMHKLYTPLAGIPDPRERILSLVGSPEVEHAVTEAAKELYKREENADPEDWGGSMILAHKTITDYIERNILPFDAARDEAFTITELEKTIEAPFAFPLHGSASVVFHGIADRIDRLADGTLRVVDYKTGRPKTPGKDNEHFRSMEALFAGAPHERISAVLQTLLYAMMLGKNAQDAAGTPAPDRVPNTPNVLNTPNTPKALNIPNAGNAAAPKVQPALYYVRNLSKPDYSPLILDAGEKRDVEQYAHYADDFEEHLRASLTELFDPATAFTQCADPKPCEWCDYNTICRR